MTEPIDARSIVWLRIHRWIAGGAWALVVGGAVCLFHGAVVVFGICMVLFQASLGAHIATCLFSGMIPDGRGGIAIRRQTRPRAFWLAWTAVAGAYSLWLWSAYSA